MEIIRKGFSTVWKIKVRCKRTLLHAVPSRLKRTDKPICSRCNIFQEIRRWQLGRMANMPKSPAMEEIISTLTYRVTLGKTHLFIDRGVVETDPVVLNLRGEHRRSENGMSARTYAKQRLKTGGLKLQRP